MSPPVYVTLTWMPLGNGTTLIPAPRDPDTSERVFCYATDVTKKHRNTFLLQYTVSPTRHPSMTFRWDPFQEEWVRID